MKFRPIIIILFMSLFGSFQVNAAVKWNNSSSSSQNDALIDVDSLEQKEVPKGFPHYVLRVTEICKVKGKYTTDLTGVVTEYIENQRYAFELQGDAISVKVEYDLEPQDGLTHVSQQTKVEFRGLMKILSIVTRRFVEANYRTTQTENFQRLEALLND